MLDVLGVGCITRSRYMEGQFVFVFDTRMLIEWEAALASMRKHRRKAGTRSACGGPSYCVACVLSYVYLCVCNVRNVMQCTAMQYNAVKSNLI